MLSARAQVEQRVDPVGADPPDEPAHGRVGRVRVHREHVVADQVHHPLGRGPRVAQPAQEHVGLAGPHDVVADGSGRRRTSPACRCRGAGGDVSRQSDRRVRGRRVHRPAACGPRGPRPGPWPGARRAGAPSSGARTASSPVSSASRRPTDGRRRRSSFASSAPIRSPETWATSGAFCARSRPGSRGSISNPSVAAKRTARTIRSASSRNRAAGSPTARSTPRVEVGAARRTGRRARSGPASPAAVEPDRQAIALTVKSRRARSASSVVAELDVGAGGGGRRTRARRGTS